MERVGRVGEVRHSVWVHSTSHVINALQCTFHCNAPTTTKAWLPAPPILKPARLCARGSSDAALTLPFHCSSHLSTHCALAQASS